MPHRLRLASILVFSVCVAIFAGPAAADPPTRVGRIGAVDGAVTVTATDQDGSYAEMATTNYPVAPGMKFSSAAGSRAELDFGTVRARIDGRTDLEVVALDDNVLGLRLTLGSIDIRVRSLMDGERITVGTSDGQVVLAKAGAYRIDAPGQGASSTGNAPYRAVTHVAVFEGAARIHSPHGGDDVFAGEAVDIDSPRGTLRYSRADSIWLDDWAADREDEIAVAAAAAARYVDRDIAGAEALGGAGTWDDTPEYGTVWYPEQVPVDWAPYQYGTWTWVSPWGWTWVDDQPWGFAPFHYGRWVRVHGRWGWCPPGDRGHRHVYAPALVTFVGAQHHERRARPNGWVPLRPGETYAPPYAHGDTYGRDINAGGRRHWSGSDGRHGPSRNTTGAGNDGRGNTGAGNDGGTTVITTTMRLPPGTNDGERGRRPRTGNDGSAPININDETFQRRPRPGVLAPVSPVTPMTTNPAGQPPAPPGPSPLAPQIDPAQARQDMNAPNGNRSDDQGGDRRRFWNHGTPDNRTTETSAPNYGGRFQNPAIPAQTTTAPPPQAPAPAGTRYVNVPGVGNIQVPVQQTQAPVTAPPQVQAPAIAPPPQALAPAANPTEMGGYGQAPRATGNTGSMPMDTYGRFQRGNPAGAAPQIPNAAPTPMQQMTPPQVMQPRVYQPQMPATPIPAFQPPPVAPAAQPPAAPAPMAQQRVFIPGVGNVQVPANVGRGNYGQGNVGAGNTGQ